MKNIKLYKKRNCVSNFDRLLNETNKIKKL